MYTVYLKTFPGFLQTHTVLKTLTDRQLKFIKQYTYRCDVNPVDNTTVLSIRTDQELINFSELLFVFPEAHTQGPAVS